jgi:signal transduction histidine kinase
MFIPKDSLILIVDDNPTNLEFLSDSLIDEGWEIVVATSGESALQKVKINLPDLILLDVKLPGIDGFETCSRLKCDPALREIPIIFMTALAEPEDKVKGLSLGAVDYITKPFQKEEVLARIRIHLHLNYLTKALAEKNQLLQEFNESLEQKVEERTEQLNSAQLQMMQQERLSSLGQLVAGIAHEINNPVGFISNNITPAKDYFADIIKILRLYQQHFPEPGEEIIEESEAIDLEFEIEDLQSILDSMQVGADRIQTLSAALRNFYRSQSEKKAIADLHDCLNSTLVILNHRLKSNDIRPEIQVIKSYGDLPTIACYPGQLNQVFMNILANAIDALEESDHGRSYQEIQAQPNQIRICTELSGDRQQAIVRIADNGKGMTPEIAQQVFERSFTTKALGKGTGLGLAISQQIVEEVHGGQLNCTSTLDRGTEFAIVLPL